MYNISSSVVPKGSYIEWVWKKGSSFSSSSRPLILLLILPLSKKGFVDCLMDYSNEFKAYEPVPERFSLVKESYWLFSQDFSWIGVA